MSGGSPFTKREKLAILGFLLAGLVGIITYLVLYDSAFPTASLNLKVTRGNALSIGEKFLKSQGYKIAGYERTVTFDYDSGAKEYLERNLGLKAANKLMGGKVKVWRWEVRWFKPMQEEEFSASVSPSGEIISFHHTIPEKQKGANLSRPAARRIAADFLKSLGLDISKYSLKDDSSDKLPNRTNHRFTWEENGFKAGKATNRVSVSVAGDRVSHLGYFLKIPEDWWRKDEGEFGQRRLLAGIAGFFYFGLTIAAIVLFLFAVRARNIRWRFIALLATVLGIVQVAASLNSLPMVKASYTTTQSMGGFIAGAIIGIIAGVVTGVLGIFVVAGSADAMYRRAFPDRMPLSRMLTVRGVLSKGFVQSSLVGFGMGLAQLGYVAAFYVIAMRYFHAWSPADVPYDNTLSTALPWIYPLTIGLSAAIDEELTFRLFGISFLKRYARFAWLAVIVPAMVWAFLHSTYPQHPAYVRGIELSVVGIALGLVFLRYGVIATIVAHYTYNAVVSGTLLIGSENLYFRISGIAVMLLMLLPLVPAAIRYLRKTPELEEEPVEIVEPPTPPARPAPVEPEIPRVYAPQSRRKLIRIACIGIASVVVTGILARDEILPLSESEKCINRKAATHRAEDYLRERGINTKGYMSYSEFGDFSGGIEEDYLVRHMDPDKAEKLIRHDLHDAGWQTSWFKPLQKERYEVSLDPDGRFYSWDHTIKEEAPGARLSASQARKLAEGWLAGQRVRLSEYTLVDSSADRKEKRTDHWFTWERKSPKVAGASFRVFAFIQGNEVMDRSDFIKIPDEYYREQEKETTRMAICGGILGLLMLAFSVFVFVVFVAQFAARRINWRLAFTWASLFVAVAVVEELNNLPTLFAGYSDTDPLSRFIWSKVLRYVLGLLGMFMSLGCAVGLADAVYRRAFPDNPTFAQWFGTKRAESWRIRAFQEGTLLALVSVGPLALAAYVADTAQKKLFPSLAQASTPTYSGLLDCHSPVIGVVTNLPLYAVVAPASLALVVSLAKLYLRRGRWIGALLVPMVFLGIGASAKNWPEFWQQILAAATGIPLALIMLRYWFGHNAYAYALFGCIWWCIAQGGTLAMSHDPALRANGIAITMLGCLPIAIAFYTCVKDRRRGPLPIEPPMPEEAPVGELDEAPR